jgi:hypothetical protein
VDESVQILKWSREKGGPGHLLATLVCVRFTLLSFSLLNDKIINSRNNRLGTKFLIMSDCLSHTSMISTQTNSPCSRLPFSPAWQASASPSRPPRPRPRRATWEPSVRRPGRGQRAQQPELREREEEEVEEEDAVLSVRPHRLRRRLLQLQRGL